MLKFIKPEPNSIFSTQNFEGVTLLTRMRLGLSLLADHKFRNNFQSCLNAIWSCSFLAIAHDFADGNSLSCFGVTFQELITSLYSEFEAALNWSDRRW